MASAEGAEPVVAPNLEQTARTGRERQRYSDDGGRLVAGCIPLRCRHDGFVEVLLVSSATNEHQWVLPKGGWEEDETQRQAAIRETWEEAGVKGHIIAEIGQYEFKPSQRHLQREGSNLTPETAPKSKATVYALQVLEILEIWPEKNRRKRKWFAIEDAIENCPKPWMKEALQTSTQFFSMITARNGAE